MDEMKSEISPDENLVALAKKGDLAAFERLIHRYEKQVFRMAWQMTENQHTAEDLAQETFVKAFQNLVTFDSGKGQFSTWLFTIARNLCRNVYRNRVQFSEIPLSECNLVGKESADDLTNRREQFKRLDLALNELEEPFRTAFVLAVVEEFPLAEIAAIEDVAIGTIKSRISRAKEQLRVHLKTSSLHE